MNSQEKHQIQKMPPKYRPLGAWGYFGYTILFNIPVIGWIIWLVCACSGSNINRRSFARSYLCGFFIALIIFVIALAIILVSSGALSGGFNMANITQAVQQFFAQIMEKLQGMMPPAGN